MFAMVGRIKKHRSRLNEAISGQPRPITASGAVQPSEPITASVAMPAAEVFPFALLAERCLARALLLHPAAATAPAPQTSSGLHRARWRGESGCCYWRQELDLLR
jgi:hypothetical protein